MLSPDQFQSLRSGMVTVRERPALFELSGSGAVECLQGLLTCDLAEAESPRLSYGAMLTPKGMILLDPFVFRADRLVLLLPGFAREIALGHFRRVLPPRLARVTDRSEEWEALWVLGDEAGPELGRKFESLPPPGRITGVGTGYLARGVPAMPFQAVAIGDRESIGALEAGLRPEALAGDEAFLAAARIRAGWPGLGREIDEKTLPQEVRYDELGAVSYSKGCYIGQETVARVHFRGHPNRVLRALELPPARSFPDRQVFHAERPAGILRTTVEVGERTLALATIRREVPDDAVLRVSGLPGRIVPFPPAEVAA